MIFSAVLPRERPDSDREQRKSFCSMPCALAAKDGSEKRDPEWMRKCFDFHNLKGYCAFL
jgi:hypothetical protein